MNPKPIESSSGLYTHKTYIRGSRTYLSPVITASREEDGEGGEQITQSLEVCIALIAKDQIS